MNERAVKFQVLRGRALAVASSPWMITLVALALRLIALDRKSLWLDEAVTLQYALKDIGSLLSIQSDPHPPLYYVLMHYWITFGQSEFALRFPSALAGSMAVPLFYHAVHEWNGKWAGVAAAWLLAIAPLHLWYSQETRMYALACTFGLASTLSYVIGFRQAHLWAWATWLVTTVIGLYVDYSMLLIVLAQIACLGLVWRKNGARLGTLLLALLALLIAALLFAPQARLFAAQLVVRGGRVWYYLSLQSLLSMLGITVSTGQLHSVVLWTGAIIFGAACVIVWMLPRRPSFQSNPAFAIATMVLYAMVLIVCAIPRGFGIKRQTLILFPYVLGVVAIVLATLRRRSAALVVLALLTLPLTGYVLLAQEQEDWRSTASLVGQAADSSDIILLNPTYMQWPFDYYYHGRVLRLGVGPTSVPKQLADSVASHTRAWLVLSSESLVDPQGTVQAWFDSHMRLAQSWSYPGIRVRLYERGTP